LFKESIEKLTTAVEMTFFALVMGAFARQTKALLRKAYVLRKQKPVKAVFEFLSPILLLAIFIILVPALPKQKMQYQTGGMHGKFSALDTFCYNNAGNNCTMAVQGEKSAEFARTVVLPKNPQMYMEWIHFQLSFLCI